MAGKIGTVAVCCGSNRGRGNGYVEAAAELGHALATRGMTLVYGGTRKGTMGVLADAVLGNGGTVHGIITQRLSDQGHRHPHVERREVVAIVSARKARMIACADAIVALPGGSAGLRNSRNPGR